MQSPAFFFFDFLYLSPSFFDNFIFCIPNLVHILNSVYPLLIIGCLNILLSAIFTVCFENAIYENFSSSYDS